MSADLTKKLNNFNKIVADLNHIKKISLAQLEGQAAALNSYFIVNAANTGLMTLPHVDMSSVAKSRLAAIKIRIISDMEAMLVEELISTHNLIGQEIKALYGASVQEIINKNETEKEDEEDDTTSTIATRSTDSTAIPF